MSSLQSELSHAKSTPRPVELINAVGRRYGGSGRDWLPFDAQALIAGAERATGLDDWGDQDFVPALKALIHSMDHEAGLNLTGRLMLGSGLRRFLTNRLKLERDWRQHPEILETAINRPIFIVGFPRTGSTLMQRLLSRDPVARSLQVWETMEPSPPQGQLAHFIDPRRLSSRGRVEFLNWAAPNFAAVHEVTPGEPEECVGLLQNTFVTDATELMANLPSYRKFVAQQDMHVPYTHYRKQLQTLQWRDSKSHWVLKSPYHQRGLPALMDLFPDALIIQTHRDPCNVAPSFCSLYQVVHELTSENAVQKLQGPQRLDWLSEVNDITLNLRQKLGPDRFIDVGFSELMRDPIGIVQRIYDRAGMKLTVAAENEMRGWHSANPQHKRGVHRYSLEEFGLSTEQVHTRLKTYYEAFGEYL